MIRARFDKVKSLADPAADETGFARAFISQVPAVGEVINLKGDPFVVVHRGWALDDGDALFAYLRVSHV